MFWSLPLVLATVIVRDNRQKLHAKQQHPPARLPLSKNANNTLASEKTRISSFLIRYLRNPTHQVAVSGDKTWTETDHPYLRAWITVPYKEVRMNRVDLCLRSLLALEICALPIWIKVSMEWGQRLAHHFLDFTALNYGKQTLKKAEGKLKDEEHFKKG